MSTPTSRNCSPRPCPAWLTFVRTILNVAPADTQRVIETLLPEETVLLTDFGMTEGAGMITVTPRDAAGEDRLTRNGTPLPGIEVRVTSPEDPKTIQPNEVPGEIQFRGINAFRAYYKNPAETAATIIDDGWVRTGDLGTLDSRGQLLFLGRIKDVLKVGGENVSPLEVEALLSTHPAVHMAQVVRTGRYRSLMPRQRGATGLLGRFRRGTARYRAVLRLPGAAAFFGTAAVARLGVAMTSLAVLWAVRGATGSFAAAGIATAGFAVAEATAGPQVARLVEERGQRRVLPGPVTVFVLAVSGLIAGAGLHLSLAVLAVTAMTAGATIPQVGSLSAARWRHIVRTPDQVAAALSLEAALNDVTFLCGPVLVSTLSTVLYPAAGLTLAGALVAAGMTAFIRQRRSEPPAHGRGDRRLVDRRLLTPAVAALFGINMAMGFFFGGIPVAITAFAFAQHAPGLAGPIAAVSSLASLSAGLVYGARTHRRPPLTVMLAVSGFLVLGTAALSLVPGVPAMFACYALVGGAVAPILIPAAVLLQRTVDPRVYTQASTWMNSASAAGIAVGAPLTGLAAQSGGWRLAFLVTAALTAALPAITLAIRRTAWPAGGKPARLLR